MTPGTRIYPDKQVAENGAALRYQGDSNLVLYGPPGALWATGTDGHRAGRAEFQHDANLVVYNADDLPIWASNTYSPGATLHIARTGLKIIATTGETVWEVETGWVEPDPEPIPPGPVRPLVGPARILGRSFGDDSGPRIFHGCSDFGALVKHHEDRDQSLRQLDVVAQYHHYIRVLWRLNGDPWVLNGTTVDPIRDAWFDDVARDYFTACQERDIRLNLTSGDMFNWTNAQAEESFRRVAQIARDVSTDLVWLSAITNEMRGTMPGGESDENIAKMGHLLRVWQSAYPWSLLAGSDPGSQDKAGMIKLAPSPANVALIHDVRWQVPDALRRAFNTAYENDPGKPIVQDEPTGENGEVPYPIGQRVYQPVNDEDDIFAIYTMHVLTGQASTYFSDPSLISREPLETTWGFTNLPRLWREMGIPEDVGQGTLSPGHSGTAFLRVNGSHASRADSMIRGKFGIGVISGSWDGQPWRVPAGYDGDYSVWYGGGRFWEGRLSAGAAVPTRGDFTPTVVVGRLS